MSRRQFIIFAAAVATGTACRGPAGPGDVDALVWGQPGKHRDGDFQKPRAVHATNDELYVVDVTGRIQVFDHDGQFLRKWAIPDHTNGTPTAIRYTADGRVVVPDTHWSRILEYTPEGELLHQWGGYGTGENEFIYPTCAAIAGDGSYFVSEYGMGAERVHIFDKDRRFVRQWGEHGGEEGHFSRAMALDLGKDGTVYVCDTANHRVQCFSPDGTFLRVFGEAGTEPGSLKFPYDMVVAPDGSLILCEYGTHRLSRFTPDGELIACFGKAGRGPGEFNAPRGVTVSPNGVVFVADTDNHRIQRLALEDIA
ncbi:MAG: hypothetical protein GY851_12665 [bacterium]|nr:hypothetical protein [bacterium]